MSISLDFGEDREGQPSGQVATNAGWTDLIDWAEEQGVDAYPALDGLIEHGVSEELTGLIAEIRGILEDDPPNSDVADTLHGMADLIERHKDEGIAVVSGQYQSGGDEDDEGEDEDFDDDEDDLDLDEDEEIDDGIDDDEDEGE